MTHNSSVKLSCIIDDDNVYIKLVTKIIELKNLSENTLVFKNGKEALLYFKNNIQSKTITDFPEIILLDLNMPVMDGWGFLSEFKKLHSQVAIKTNLYIVSSSINKEEIARAKSIDIVLDYLIKPVHINTFENLFKRNRIRA